MIKLKWQEPYYKTIKTYCGHAPGHVRETFEQAVEAFSDWNGSDPEPMVSFEVQYEPRSITLSEACVLLWNCTDVMPSMMVAELRDRLEVRKMTYAAGARAMRQWIRAKKEPLS